MKLVVPIPPDWKHRAVAEGVLYQSPVPIFGMLVMPLVDAHEDPESWLPQALRHRQAKGEARNLKLSQLATEDGWTAIVLEGEVGSEARLVAYFPFLDYAATVIVLCRDPAAMPTWRGAALEILVKARPDFGREEVVCLAHQLGARPPAAATLPLDGRGAISGWHRSFAGDDVVLTGDEGPRAGRIRIGQRFVPLRPLSEIFAPFLAAARAPDVKVEGPTLMVTGEGEYAAVASAAGGGRQHTRGVVFGDDHYAQIDGTATVPEQFARFRAAVERLTYAHTLGLGPTRWRRFYYEPPPEWIGVARTRGALWISPSCPRHYQAMRVFDARPPTENRAARHGARLIETLPQEFFVEPPSAPFEFHTAEGLSCRVIAYTGRVPNRRTTIKAIEGTVIDARYIYPVRMECDAELLEPTMHVFERAVSSIRLLPERGPDLDPDMGVLTSWVD